ncbi:hypothetical protein sos41_15680 [Alphaproteobacteria bacterium SO-S41]|nr:hypothetical protein sos41_15680 [Alphaproteobacteria bacterium SO-S41]
MTQRGEGTARQIAVDDFHVPRAYLGLLIGADAAARILARGDGQHGAAAGDVHLQSVRFLNACLEQMQTLADESYGVAPRPVPLGTFGLLTAAAAQADDFEGALTRFVDAARILRPDIVMQASRNRNGLSLSLRYRGKRTARSELLVECFAMTAHCAFRWLTGQRLRLVQIRVGTPLPGFERSMLHKVMGCPVSQQAAGTMLRYAPETAAAPLAAVKYQNWAAQELGEFMRLLGEAADEMNAAASRAVADIVRRVRQAIAGGARSEIATSQTLGMSPATLRRRLAEVGQSFRAILADTQRNAVESLFVTDKPLEDIAAEIGYSDVRSLRRACQRWFGVTPTAYRHGRRRARSGHGAAGATLRA